MSRSTSKVTPIGARRSLWLDINLSRPHGTLSRDGKYKWSTGWQKWVPTGKETLVELELPGPLESGPLLPERHSASCLCGECMTAGQRYADYLKAKSTWPS